MKYAISTPVFSLLNGLVEQDAIVFAASKQIINARLDLSNLTQNTNIREYEKVDGVNYRELSNKLWPTQFDTGCTGVSFSFTQADAAYKITLQSTIAEGADRSVPTRSTVESRT